MRYTLRAAIIFTICSLFSQRPAHAESRVDATQADDQPAYYSEIIRLEADDPEGMLEDILDYGCIILNRRQDLVLALIPADGPVGTAASAIMRWASRLRNLHVPGISPTPTMDVALRLSGAERIITGNRLPQPYTGEGVVVGFCDVGFDTRHLNFIGADGKCRIAKVVKYTESEGKREEFTSPEAIYAMHTDNADEYHATHVAGILAGGHSLSHMAGIENGGTLTGIASGAEIVATVSELSEVGLLSGVEDIIAYAKERGLPAVVNLSVGNYTGPHDGSSLFCKYLDMCAEDAVICISSGNEGGKTNHQYLPAASSDSPLRVRVAGSDWVNLRLYGQTDIYAADSTPFTLTMRVADSPKDPHDAIIYESEPIDLSLTPFIVFSSEEAADDPYVVYDPAFAEHFDGKVYISGGINPENDRYYASVNYNCTTTEPYSDERRWARYRLEFAARPQSPVRLDAYADGTHSWLSAVQGNTSQPGNEISVSDLATGFKTISVGMYCTRSGIPLLNGSTFTGEGEWPFVISEYSGYGSLPDGRSLPLTSAPGRPILSSFSRPYVDTHGEDLCTLFVERNGERHYWGPMSGTSMSSPFVAGTIATWLQAAPHLNWQDVRQILLDTNYYPTLPDGHDTASDPRYGMGFIDPYAGLKKALEAAAGVAGTLADNSALSASLAADRLLIGNARGENITVSVHSCTGISLGSRSVGCEPLIELPLNRLGIPLDASPIVITVRGESSTPVTLKAIGINR